MRFAVSRSNALLLAGLITLVALQGCLGIPKNVEPVENFELDRYLGTWYEVAMDHSFERGMSSVTANYALREDGGVRVINRGFKDTDQVWDEAEGKAFFIDGTDTGRLKVSFFGPFYGSYNIIALDQEDYAWSLVAGPNSSYLWILSRTPEMDPSVYADLVGRAEAAGFAVNELIRVAHPVDTQIN
jgi:apolipoprotein D and lipocalin family protein